VSKGITEPPKAAAKSSALAEDNLPIFRDDSDDAFLDLIKGRLPDNSQRELELLEAVKSVYVPCKRDRILASMLDTFVISMLARKDGRRDDGRVFFITGESGAGKTRCIDHMLANCKTLQPISTPYGPQRSVISTSLSGGAATLKMVGHQIVNAAGYSLKTTTEQSALWNRLPEILHQKRVLLVHIDETQHVLRRTETDHERKTLAKAIKGLTNYSAWPVSFILSGTPETDEIARLDEQFERRGTFMRLPDISMPGERVLVTKIMDAMAQKAELSLGELPKSDVPDRVAHAARYRYGRVTQVVLAAIHVAIRQSAQELSREHFAEAYLQHSHARGIDEMNPFLMDDWQEIAPGAFLMEDQH
jgi:hypothetical protein